MSDSECEIIYVIVLKFRVNRRLLGVRKQSTAPNIRIRLKLLVFATKIACALFGSTSDNRRWASDFSAARLFL